MRIADHVQEQNSELRVEVKELKSSLGEVTAIVQTLRTDLATPTLNHTHHGKLEYLVKADSERATAVQHLRRELANFQGEVEGLKEKAKHGVPLVQQDGRLQSVGERDIQRDFPSSQLQTRDAVPIRSAGQSIVDANFKRVATACLFHPPIDLVRIHY